MITGDDCVSIGNGTSNVNVSWIDCGPGHGIRFVSAACHDILCRQCHEEKNVINDMENKMEGSGWPSSRTNLLAFYIKQKEKSKSDDQHNIVFKM